MRNINKLMVGLLLLNMLVVPSMAAETTNNSAPNLMPNLATGWNGLPDSIHTWIFWIIGVAFVALVVVVIISMFGGAIKALFGHKTGNVAGRSSGFSDIFLGAGILVAAIIGVMLVIYVASLV